MKIDGDLIRELEFLLYNRESLEITSRTKTHRISNRESSTIFIYDLGDNGNELPLTELRKASPMAAIAEVMWMLSNTDALDDIAAFNPSLANIWKSWASDGGRLGGVYSKAYRSCNKPNYDPNYDQFKKIIDLLRNEDTKYTTHARMTTMLPEFLPEEGKSYNQNVIEGKFALYPCLNTFQFLVGKDEAGVDRVNMQAFQSSADAIIGLSPHNFVQCATLLLIVSKLTGIKSGLITHHVSDFHYYENQEYEVEELIRRYHQLQMPYQPENVHNPIIHMPDNLLAIYDCDFDGMVDIYKQIKVTGISQLPKLDIKVDS